MIINFLQISIKFLWIGRDLLYAEELIHESSWFEYILIFYFTIKWSLPHFEKIHLWKIKLFLNLDLPTLRLAKLAGCVNPASDHPEPCSLPPPNPPWLSIFSESWGLAFVCIVARIGEEPLTVGCPFERPLESAPEMHIFLTLWRGNWEAAFFI